MNYCLHVEKIFTVVVPFFLVTMYAFAATFSLIMFLVNNLNALHITYFLILSYSWSKESLFSLGGYMEKHL